MCKIAIWTRIFKLQELPFWLIQVNYVNVCNHDIKGRVVPFGGNHATVHIPHGVLAVHRGGVHDPAVPPCKTDNQPQLPFHRRSASIQSD